MKTVIFVSDSNLDLYNERALVGSRHYGTFLQYLASLDLSVNDTLIYNEKDYQTIEAIAVSDSGVRVVTLGAVPRAAMNKLNVPCFALPDLEMTGRVLQSLDFKETINSCKGYIHDSRGH